MVIRKEESKKASDSLSVMGLGHQSFVYSQVSFNFLTDRHLASLVSVGFDDDIPYNTPDKKILDLAVKYQTMPFNGVVAAYICNPCPCSNKYISNR